ncbi:MAG TPA: hypothetical protein PK986_06300 [Spirochaetota bacterium]|nr:hypothetical protein [Spirochaetota bacterium]HQO40060.1 hypothetical protein [Spirochaetota bacterium]
MIYLAVLLILTGLLILLLSVFTESGAGINAIKSVRTVKNTSRVQPDPEEIEIPLPDDPDAMTDVSYEIDDFNDEDLFVDFSMDESEPATRDLLDDELSGSFTVHGKDKVDFREDNPARENGSLQRTAGGVSAILFDDRSNMIDYDSGSASIDASIEGYKNIKRIGSGNLSVERDGLSFYLGDSLYRFDFHRIFDIWSGDNFIALPLKGSGTVKLFLLERGNGLPEKVEKYFQEYTKG